MGLSKDIHIKCLQLFIILYLETCNVIVILELYYGSSYVQFERFVSIVLVEQVGVCCFIIHLTYYETLNKYPQFVKAFCWTWDSTRKDTFRRIMNVFNSIQILVKIYLIAATLGPGIFFAQYEYRYNVVLDVARNKAGNTGILFSVLYYLTTLSLGYGAACVSLFTMYISAHIEFQFLLLADVIATTKLEFNQNLIYQKLKTSVEHHVRIKLFSKSLFSIQWAVVTMSFGGAAHYAGGIWFILLEENLYSSMLPMLGMIVSLAYGFENFQRGQNIKNESTNFFETVRACPWVNWNKKNRMALQMIMINSAKPLNFNSFGLIDLDYTLATRVYRIVYTLMTSIIKLK